MEDERNVITEVWLDKKNRMGRMLLNGHHLPVFFVEGKWSDKTCSYSQWLMVRVANYWNASNPIGIKAATMRTLQKKIENHPHRLVRFRE